MSTGPGLEQRVLDAFSPTGALSQHTLQFCSRAAQTDMAHAVAQTIGADPEGRRALVVEAGTGVGKTFSYLVPALLSGERVLVSTATKTLQDQLFGRDLPHLIRALGLSVRTALLKGRGSYLCLHRMQLARSDAHLPDRATVHALAKVERWSQVTRSGDLAELSGLDERSPVIPLVTSTRENCLGASCPQFRPCHVNLARREALAADLVVINHHLFFADLAVRESGMAELLPTVGAVIFDEAHQLNEIGVQFLGTHLSTGQLLDFVRDLLGTGLQQARGLADWQALAASTERATRDWRLLGGKAPYGGKLRWTGSAPQDLPDEAWHSALAAVEQALLGAVATLDTVSEIGPDFVRLHERAVELAGRVATFLQPCEAGSVRWVDVGAQLRAVQSPLDIADAVQTRLLGRATSVAWVFTSATLGDDAALTWFTEPCGLAGARIERYGSPFDYAQQAALYVPRELPKPGDASHPVRVAELTAQAARQLGGRTMVLTTTLRALRQIGDKLKSEFATDGLLEVLVQGDMSKHLLIERFRQAGHTGVGCVLVASVSFWEGVDIPGDALQLVVIDKLPFPPPGDPLVEARATRLENQGRSPFNDYFVPEAAVMLKQGAGRLIRKETDQGLLVVCDTRLVQMGYGRRLLAALPPMRRLGSSAEFQATLDALTRVSTTDPKSTLNPC